MRSESNCICANKKMSFVYMSGGPEDGVASTSINLRDASANKGSGTFWTCTAPPEGPALQPIALGPPACRHWSKSPDVKSKVSGLEVLLPTSRRRTGTECRDLKTKKNSPMKIINSLRNRCSSWGRVKVSFHDGVFTGMSLHTRKKYNQALKILLQSP
ncbi:uncharacterized protein LOC144066049 isoform X2 [Stigmatopora argus]